MALQDRPLLTGQCLPSPVVGQRQVLGGPKEKEIVHPAHQQSGAVAGPKCERLGLVLFDQLPAKEDDCKEPR